MARIIETGETSAKQRQMHLRSCAEVLRLLAERPVFEEEERDMLAFLVFSLRNIYVTIEESARAWDDRDYWKKAEALREKWRWSRNAADKLENLIRRGRWEAIPPRLMELLPYLSDITVSSITRDSDWWCGAYRALMKSSTTPTS